MIKVHPLTGIPPADALAVRTGGVTGVVGAFGWSRRNADGTPRGHWGVDWPIALASHVFAAHDGRVTRDGEEHGGGGYGWRLNVDSGDGTETRYCHLCVQFVRLGDLVRAGDCIGLVGRSGNVGRRTPTHLHFEVREHDGAVDPVWWLHGDGDRHGVPKPSIVA